jgi:Putative lumazine-binding
MATDEGAIVAAALDYFEGWYRADPERMDRALHLELVKGWVGDTHGTSPGETRTKEHMLERTRARGGAVDRTDEDFEVVVAEVHRDTPTAIVRSRQYREYLHLVRAADGWRIVNAFRQEPS